MIVESLGSFRKACPETLGRICKFVSRFPKPPPPPPPPKRRIKP